MTRRGRRKKRVANQIRQLPWRDVVNPYAPSEILSQDQVETIIDTALGVLATQGMRFLEPSGRDLLAKAGAQVDGEIVRFDPDFVRESVAQAPAEFGLRARNPEHNLTIGGAHTVFTSVGGPAFCSDLDNGRRPGNYAEM